MFLKKETRATDSVPACPDVDGLTFSSVEELAHPASSLTERSGKDGAAQRPTREESFEGSIPPALCLVVAEDESVVTSFCPP